MTNAWRFIDTGPCSAAYNMALDESIAFAVRKDDAPPTLRLYGWDSPSVSIGCFQKISDIDINYCIRNRIPVVRRPTGGRAILHGSEITYSFSVRTSNREFSRGLLDSYKKISGAICSALSRIGFSPELRLLREPPALKTSLCFQSISYAEITINKKKVVGSAQKRWADGLLQQGSIPLSIDRDKTVKAFKLQCAQGIEELITGLKEVFPQMSTDELKEAIRTSFDEAFNIKLIASNPTHAEISLARELEYQKYRSHQWNFKK